jgi:uncharacterized protein YecT (DUF1311 family)
MVVGGVGAAVALGLVLGIAARPNIGQHGLKPVPMQPVTRASTDTIDIEVNKPAVLPAPKPMGRLEVLPPDLAAAARPAVVAVAPAARMDAPPAAPPIDRAPPRPAANASFDCSAAGSTSERMVCGDAGLARTDRRLQQAYARAMASGAMPRRELREEQQDWLSIREQAARRSPDAVRSVYEQRIDELDALADGEGPP